MRLQINYFIVLTGLLLMLSVTYGNSSYIGKSITILPPVISTVQVTSITQNTAISGGVVSSNGGSPIINMGVCWSTSSNPTISDSSTITPGATGTFSNSLVGLIANTVYYVRAYATNADGTSYGQEISFTTSSQPDTFPLFITATAKSITENSAISGGVISEDRGAVITSRGVCWSTLINPVFTDSHTIDGNGLGSYTSNMSGLSGGTLYYVRAYAINSNGISYGSQETFTTLGVAYQPPTLTTTVATGITSTTASSGGNITSDGGAQVTVRGVCWSTATNPDITNSLTSDGTGIGPFVSNITGLMPNTTYYVRAYATNSSGTAYGNEVIFTTMPIPNCDDTTAPYSNVTIGTQTWMQKSLNVCTYRNGDPIPEVTDPTEWANLTTGAWCYYENNTANGLEYGKLYNWYAVNDSRGLAPAGWHVANDAEWGTLISFLGGESVAGGKMKETGLVHWINPNVATNSSAFTGLGGGYRSPNGSFTWFKTLNYMWSSTYESPVAAGAHSLRHWDGEIMRHNSNSIKGGGSVRCVMNTALTQPPTLTTTDATGVTETTANSGGDITSDGGAPVTARGICWSTTANPDITDNTTSDGTGTGIFISNISGLTPGTTYYVRAYATNSYGTAYGNEVIFTTTVSVPTCGNMTDIDGNVYNAVTIGTQCWTQTNLNVSKYRNGDVIPQVTDPIQWANLTTGAWCYYENNTANGPVYGKLYNWYAVNDPRELTPNGWHVPSEAEWTILTDYLGGVTVAGGKMKSITGWQAPNTGADNSSGFTGLSGGQRSPNPSTFTDVGDYGFWWSYTEEGTNTAWDRYLSYNNAGAPIDWGTKVYGMSVRCIKDTASTQPPTLTTDVTTGITETTATSGGNITLDGGTPVTVRGICWSTTTNPNITDTITTDGSGIGAFVSNMAGLTPGTTYYVRAYATNSNGTSYGNEVVFTTTVVIPTCGNMTDIDGNVYNAITIGTQCWTQTNLNVTKYRNGDVIPQVTDPTAWANLTTGAWCYYANDSANGLVYGKLYNWYAINDPRGLAPIGWRIPNDSEWTTLVNYLGGETVAGGKMKNITGWPTPNTGADNSSGFTALPGGHKGAFGGFINGGLMGYWWSFTEINTSNSWHRIIAGTSASIFNSDILKSNGLSVRCTKDTTSSQLSTLTTTAATGVTETSAISGGNITLDGGAPVTVRGICWSTTTNPDITDNTTSNGSGVGTFVSNISGLTPNTTYYIRAYGTNSAGTAYGNEVVFTTTMSIQTCGTMTDIDGNVYNAVTIGTQCWTQTNLNVSKYRNGDVIPQVTDPTQWENLTTGAWCYYENNTANGPVYGKLYNWYAVNDSRGLAPTGWHIPTDTEWTILTNYLGGVAVAGGKMKESGTAHWLSPNTAADNSSGFTALPGGYRKTFGEFAIMTANGYWWSSTESLAITAWTRTIGYSRANATKLGIHKKSGISVRCVKDATVPQPPTLTTTAATGITETTATSGGNITSDGGSPVTVRGICWSTTANPDITDSTISDGSGVGTFVNNMAGLMLGTTYYVRAYATNSNGTAYGNEVVFTTTVATQPPTLTTTDATGITETTATSGGNITSDGGSPVTVRGICWSTTTNPDITDSTTSDGTGTGTFVSNMAGLISGTTYYVRAYATNSNGTAYGNELVFTTLDIPSCTDNATPYPEITIGTQVWMQKNLDVCTYRNGDPIPEVTDLTEWNNLTTGAWCYYENNTANGPVYGKLYNQYAVNDSRGLAPEGWHVPEGNEFETLNVFLGAATEGGQMKEVGTTHWESPNTGATNSSGFTALPGGIRWQFGFNNIGAITRFWASDANISFSLTNISNDMSPIGGPPSYGGCSVRCVKD